MVNLALFATLSMLCCVAIYAASNLYFIFLILKIQYIKFVKFSFLAFETRLANMVHFQSNCIKCFHISDIVGLGRRKLRITFV